MKASAVISILAGALLAACAGPDQTSDQPPADTADAASDAAVVVANHQLAWVDRSGSSLGTVGPAMNSILDPSISPAGDAVAVRGRASVSGSLV